MKVLLSNKRSDDHVYHGRPNRLLRKRSRRRPRLQTNAAIQASSSDIDELISSFKKLSIDWINDVQLGDNCYLCAATYLANKKNGLNMTVSDFSNAIKYTHKGTVAFPIVLAVLKKAGCSGTFQTGSPQTLASSGIQGQYALAFIRSNTTKHVIIIDTSRTLPLFDPQSGKAMSWSEWLQNESPVACAVIS